VCLALYIDWLFCFCCAVCRVYFGTKISNNSIMFIFKNSITPSLFSHERFCKGVFFCMFLLYIYLMMKQHSVTIIFLSLHFIKWANKQPWYLYCRGPGVCGSVQVLCISATAVFLQVHVNLLRTSSLLPVKSKDNFEGM